MKIQNRLLPFLISLSLLSNFTSIQPVMTARRGPGETQDVSFEETRKILQQKSLSYQDARKAVTQESDFWKQQAWEKLTNLKDVASIELGGNEKKSETQLSKERINRNLKIGGSIILAFALAAGGYFAYKKITKSTETIAPKKKLVYKQGKAPKKKKKTRGSTTYKEASEKTYQQARRRIKTKRKMNPFYIPPKNITPAGDVLREDPKIKSLRNALFSQNKNEALLATNNLEAFLAMDQAEGYSDMLNLVKQEELKNPVRKKLAQKWIRNAAVRIFHDPLRSFLELIVNSCDATTKKFFEKPSVGKFGMGFFSILSFLWHEETSNWDDTSKKDKDYVNSGTTITITTATRHDEFEPLSLFKMVFKKNDANDISIDFKKIPEDDVEYIKFIKQMLDIQPFDYFIKLANNPRYLANMPNFFSTESIKKRFLEPKEKTDLAENQKYMIKRFEEALKKQKDNKEFNVMERLKGLFPSGTIISIEPTNGNNRFSQTTQEKLSYYTHYLDTFSDISVLLKTPQLKPQETYVGSNLKSGLPVVKVIIDDKRIQAIDSGIGMTPEIALHKLLVPSATTKSEKSLKEAQNEILKEKTLGVEFTNFKGKPQEKQNDSHFLMTINGVVVIDKVLSKPIPGGKDLALHMPQVTQLTLARNELAINPDGTGFEEAYLKKTIDQTIDNVINKNGDHKTLLALFRGLKEWESQSAARHIHGLFSGYLKNQINEQLIANKNLVPVPELFAEQGKPKAEGDERFVTLNHELVNYNFQRFE